MSHPFRAEARGRSGADGGIPGEAGRIDELVPFLSGTNKGTNTQWSLCGVSSDEIGSTYGESWEVDVVRTSPSLAVSGGED